MASLEIIRLSRTAFTRLRTEPHLIGETNGQEGHGGVLMGFKKKSEVNSSP